MSIKKLKQFPQEVSEQKKTPQCEASVGSAGYSTDWRLEHGQKGPPFQCSRPSVVEIDGKHYCRLHGGHKALEMYLSGKLIETDTVLKAVNATVSHPDKGRLADKLNKLVEANS